MVFTSDFPYFVYLE